MFSLQLTIRQKFTLLLSLFTVGLLAVGAVGFKGIQELRSHADSMGRIQDLAAVSLPPVISVEPAYLNLLRAASERHEGDRAKQIEEAKRNEQEYRAGIAVWRTKLASEPEIVKQLEALADDGERFFAAVDADLLPAFEAGDLERARSLMATELSDVYDVYEPKIDDLTRSITAAENREQAGFDGVTNTVRWSVIVLVPVITALALLIGITMIAGIVRRLGATQDVLARVSEGDLTAHIVEGVPDELGAMARSTNHLVASLSGAMGGVLQASNLVASASEQLSAGATDISSGAQEQASSLEETAASLEQITSTVRLNSDAAQQANQLATNSREIAERGGRVVGTAVEAMTEINKRSKAIADIITTIDEIAFQTNLLALNAAVEAARAGEQGRGFAVVATEVRNLAQRSAGAAKEIKTLIKDSVRQIEDGTTLVNQSGQTLDEIVQSVKRLTDIVAEIAAASREQTSGIDQVNTAVSRMDQVTQASAAQTEELSATAQSLSQQACALQSMVSKFKLGHEGVTAADRSAAAHAAPAAPKLAKVLPGPGSSTAPAQARRVRVAAAGGSGEFEEF